MSLQGKNLSSWNTWLGLWSPGLKNTYIVELQSYDPDEDVEKKKLSIGKNSTLTLHYQVFGLVISIPDKHAVEEIEVGRVPQIIFLLASRWWMDVSPECHSWFVLGAEASLRPHGRDLWRKNLGVDIRTSWRDAESKMMFELTWMYSARFEHV